MKLDELLSRQSVVGIIGNRGTAKSSLGLSKIVELKKSYPDLSIAAMGVEESLEPMLRDNKITIIESKMDILDLQMENTVIYIDELALFFSTRNKSKELEKLERFFDRIEHQNCKLVVSTAREGYFNKFMCARIGSFLVKEIEYTALVNGTWLSERVKAINSKSDYRLECDKSNYYSVSNKEGITQRHSFKYDERFDSKKSNANLFAKKNAERKAVGNAHVFPKNFITEVKDELS
jgi:hypothetical protein